MQKKPPIFIPITLKEKIAEKLVSKSEIHYQLGNVRRSLLIGFFAGLFASERQIHAWDCYSEWEALQN